MGSVFSGWCARGSEIVAGFLSRAAGVARTLGPMQRLSLPFTVHDLAGTISVEVCANADPYATGHHLFAQNFDAAAFTGFPLLTAHMRYPGQGMLGRFAWIQLIGHWRSGELVGEVLDTDPQMPDFPFYVSGYHPTFADAPANPEHLDMQWRAVTFLLQAPVNRTIAPLTGFRWGYGRSASGETELLELTVAGAPAWERVRSLLARDYPSWHTEPLES